MNAIFVVDSDVRFFDVTVIQVHFILFFVNIIFRRE